MASLYPETDTTPSPSHTTNASTVLDVFDKTETEINSHFNWLHQILKDKNKAILDKLREKRAEFVELEADRVRQIEEIETMKQQLLNLGVKSIETNLLREQTINGYDNALKKLKLPIQPEKIICEKFSEKLKDLISSIDLKFVEEDYKTKINPIISINRDYILNCINAMKPPFEPGYFWGWGRAKEKQDIQIFDLSDLAYDSKTNRIFALDNESNNILVFQQDGTLTACFGEELKDVTDLCIDNRFIYVLDMRNCIYKFDLTTHLLSKKKDNKNIEIKNEMLCLDTQNGEIYVGTGKKGIYIFSSEIEHIRSISTYTIGCIDIHCSDKHIFMYALFPNGLNIYSYNGDSIRKIHLLFDLKPSHGFNWMVSINKPSYRIQFSIDIINSLIFISNPFEKCICIQTFGGQLVHKIEFGNEEKNEIFPTGIDISNDGRIIISLANSKVPLRIY